MPRNTADFNEGQGKSIPNFPAPHSPWPRGTGDKGMTAKEAKHEYESHLWNKVVGPDDPARWQAASEAHARGEDK